MSTRDALIQKIDKQPEWVLKEMHVFLDSLTPNKQSGWPKGYFESTAGVFANEPFERPQQLPLEKREDW
jgi:hypothetical protein